MVQSEKPAEIKRLANEIRKQISELQQVLSVVDVVQLHGQPTDQLTTDQHQLVYFMSAALHNLLAQATVFPAYQVIVQMDLIER